MKSLPVCCMLLAFLFSCRAGKPPLAITETIAIDLTESVESQEPAEKWIEKMEFIPLETNPDCYVSGTYWSNLNNDHFVVASGESVHLFSRSGRHLKSINRFGKGPGEYGNSIRVNLVPDRDEIVVIDPNQRKIICFDYDGKLICEIKTAFMPINVAPVAGGLFACYIGRMLGVWDQNREPFQLVFLNRMGKIESKYLPFTFTTLFGQGSCGFTNSGYPGSSLINPVYDYTIYQVGPGNRFAVKYRFDFGQFNVDTSLLNDEKILSLKNPGQLFGDQKLNLDHLAVTSNTISFWGPVVRTPMRFGSRQINRTTGHVRFMEVDSIQNLGSYAGIPIQFSEKAAGEYFITSLDAVDLVEIIKKLTPDQRKLLSKFKGFDRLSNLKEDDNPVLVLYQVKDF